MILPKPHISKSLVHWMPSFHMIGRKTTENDLNFKIQQQKVITNSHIISVSFLFAYFISLKQFQRKRRYAWPRFKNSVLLHLSCTKEYVVQKLRIMNNIEIQAFQSWKKKQAGQNLQRVQFLCSLVYIIFLYIMFMDYLSLWFL